MSTIFWGRHGENLANIKKELKKMVSFKNKPPKWNCFFLIHWLTE